MYYLAFLDLTSCRGSGYGTEGPISWLAIAEYAEHKAIEGEQLEDLFYFVTNMDATYLEFKTKKIANSTPPPKGGKGKK